MTRSVIFSGQGCLFEPREQNTPHELRRRFWRKFQSPRQSAENLCHAMINDIRAISCRLEPSARIRLDSDDMRDR